MSVSSAGEVLGAAVDRFCAGVTASLLEVTRAADGAIGASAEDLAGDVTIEAYRIASAFIDSDGRHSDDELLPLIATFGGRLDTQLGGATPATIREAGLLKGARRWLDQPSDLFEILLGADRAHGTDRALGYYRAAMEIAHTIVALDVISTEGELAAIDAFRTMLLGRIGPGRAGSTPSDTGSGTAPPPAPAAGGAPRAADTAAAEDSPASPEPLPPPRPLEELMAELDALIGLAEVKAEVRRLTDLIRVGQLRAEHDLPVSERSNHLVFTGNPGTGKTTVARLLAQIYRTLGVVERGHLVEVDRSALVAGFVGQTAPLVTKRFDEADEGMLFIDEAYSLIRGSESDFGREAVDTLVKLVEDRRDRVVVVVAGYPDEMSAFLDVNPGLRSRFPRTVFFPDYSTDDLLAIFELLAAKSGYELADDARIRLAEVLDAVPREEGFGNGRLARNLLEETMAGHASRVVALDSPTRDDLALLTAADVPDQPPGHR
ncbi:MAG: AAA family ATPase [Microthrixaceae bacterium]